MASLQLDDTASTTQVEENGTPALVLSAAVQTFCQRHDLLPYLQLAVRIAKECFQPVTLDVQMEQDPETGEQWLMVAVAVRKGTVQLRNVYRKYTSQWAPAVPWPALYMIRISYDLI